MHILWQGWSSYCSSHSTIRMIFGIFSVSSVQCIFSVFKIKSENGHQYIQIIHQKPMCHWEWARQMFNFNHDPPSMNARAFGARQPPQSVPPTLPYSLLLKIILKNLCLESRYPCDYTCSFDFTSPGSGRTAACNYWSNLGSVHQVPITAGWAEALWNTKFAWHFYTWPALGIELQTTDFESHLATCSHKVITFVCHLGGKKHP